MTQPAEAGTLSGTLMDTTQTQALFCGGMAGTPQPLSPLLRALRKAHEPLPMVTHNIPARGTTADYGRHDGSNKVQLFCECAKCQQD